MASETWAYEQNMDGGGSPIQHSYAVFVDSTADETEYVAEVYREDHASMIAAAPSLYAALEDVFALMDEGYLVRDTSGDGAPDWAIKQLPFIQRLQAAQAALAAARGESTP